MTVAVHQPNFLPWLGYFDKINKADAFVFLNHVLINPRTSTYLKRVSILVSGSEHNFVVPLKNKDKLAFQPINELEIDVKSKIYLNAIKTFEFNYKRAPFFADSYNLLSVFFSHPSALIADRNIAFVNEVCKVLKINTAKLISSELSPSGASNDMLIDIVKKANGSCYLAGGGASGYQNDEQFTQSGVEVKYQNFTHPIYHQYNSANFVKGLSVLDAIANLGIDKTVELLQKLKSEFQ